jgi:cytochrome c1
MNRVTKVVPAKHVIIIVMAVGVIALAVLGAQAVLITESPLGLEAEPVFVDDLAPAEPAASAANASEIDHDLAGATDEQLAAIVTYLQSVEGSAAIASEVDHDLAGATDEQLAAIVTYLQSVEGSAANMPR